MVIMRFGVALLAMLAIEATVFAIHYRDLIFLRTAASTLANTPSEEFRSHATSALARETLTRRHLDTIAAEARRRSMIDLELDALRRAHATSPDDIDTTFALADAARRAGRFAEAEALYQSLLQLSARDGRGP